MNDLASWFRPLAREEIPWVWMIDRSEVIDGICTFRDGKLELQPTHFAMRSWPTGEAAKYTRATYGRPLVMGLLHTADLETPPPWLSNTSEPKGCLCKWEK